jgi:hypothetical protein
MNHKFMSSLNQSLHLDLSLRLLFEGSFLKQIRNSIEKKPHHSIAYSALLFFSLFMGWLSLLAGIRVNIPLDREREKEE